MRLKKGDIIFLDLEDELNSYNSDFLEYYNSVKGIFTVYRDKEDFEENFLVHDFKKNLIGTVLYIQLK
jgi:hypothetical protein